MADIDRITKVDIVLQTTGLSEMGFNTQLLAGTHAATVNRVLIITEPDELLALGFSADSVLYLMASTAFSQTPRPSHVKIGKIAATAADVTVDGPVVTGSSYTLTMAGKLQDGSAWTAPFTYVAAEGDDASGVLAGIKALLDANADPVITSTIVGESLTVSMAGEQWSAVAGSGLAASYGSAASDITGDLAAIYAEDADWYVLHLDSREDEAIKQAAAWTQTKELLFGTASASPAVLDSASSDDLFSQLKAESYSRTFGFYHADAATDFPEIALTTKKLAEQPGSETWANATLSAVKSDNLGEGQAKAVFTKNGNTFEPFRNIALTQNGKVFSGEWIDVIRFIDWLKERIRVLGTQALVDTKVPYTDPGITLIGAAVKQALIEGQGAGGIAYDETDEANKLLKGFSVTLPKSASIPAQTKATRVLSGIKFTARLTGAIHQTVIDGTVTY